MREGAYRFLTTGDPDAFRASGQSLLQLPIDEVEHVDRCRTDQGGRVKRADGRTPGDLRPLDVQVDFLEQPHGSVLYAQGTHDCSLHGDGRGGDPALAAREGEGLDDRRVRDVAGCQRANGRNGVSRVAGPTGARSRSSD